MKSPYEIVKVPFMTEKSNKMNEAYSKVTFIVDRSATKAEIARAVSEIFNCHVVRVNSIRMEGKKKRLGVHQGRRSHWKKAVCTLAKGEKIDVVEGI
ncbi:MAG: 50S ribosomal protein L23 [bacterium]